ncbi:hypothetical protein [Bradyrhizobium sp. BR 1433]|uniref:hypothetical protein n=1 Tax=Bradyrhizobium sp. BR 1433 TaxID=3447967 RepID=UPI003EE510CC
MSLNDRAALLNSLSMLADDPERAIRLGLAGRAAVAGNFNWQHDAVELNELYRRFASLGAAA